MVRAELRLARPSSEPLAHLALSPDPLQSFARVLAGLDHERGEQRAGRGRSAADDRRRHGGGCGAGCCDRPAVGEPDGP